MRTLSAHQPAYLPWLGYFNKIAYSDIFIILDAVQFEKGSFVNRNRIKGPNGIFWLTVPIKEHALNVKICDLRIVESNWHKKQLKSIEQFYKNASCYNGWLISQISNINTINDIIKMTRTLSWGQVDIDCNIILQQTAIKKFKSHKQQLIIDLCKHFNADRFIFGEQGRNYVDMDLWKREGIEPLSQDFKCIEYPQLWGDFVPKLSVIDALMNVGAKRTRELIMEGWKP